jgi:hypothetical protein
VACLHGFPGFVSGRQSVFAGFSGKFKQARMDAGTNPPVTRAASHFEKLILLNDSAARRRKISNEANKYLRPGYTSRFDG